MLMGPVVMENYKVIDPDETEAVAIQPALPCNHEGIDGKVSQAA